MFDVDIRWITDHGSCKRDSDPLAARFTMSLAARRLARSSNHSRQQQIDKFNRSKTGRVPLTGGETEVAWRQTLSRGRIVLPMQAGVKTKVFALWIQFGRALLAVTESQEVRGLRPERGLQSACCKPDSVPMTLIDQARGILTAHDCLHQLLRELFSHLSPYDCPWKAEGSRLEFPSARFCLGDPFWPRRARCLPSGGAVVQRRESGGDVPRSFGR